MYQLKTRTCYSLLHSLVRIPQYVNQAKLNGEKAIGIMDENVLYGALEFYQSAKVAGLKAIIGMSLEYTSKNGTFWLHLIAKNHAGYQNLMRLSSQKMTQETMELASFLPLLKDLAVVFDENSEFAYLAKSDFGSLDGFLENFEESYYGVDEYAQEILLETANQMNLPLLAFREVRYLKREDARAYQVANAIAEQKILNIEDIDKFGNLHYLSAQEFELKMNDRGLAQACQNTRKLVEEIYFELPTGQTLLPQFNLSQEEASAGEYLRKLVFEKLHERVPNADERYTKRLEMELSVIHEMGFDDYFLIVWDMLDFAHKNKIYMGAGRGSAAGSLVAFVLSITAVDPIKYDLLFERFLNIERNEMPDIDIDIPDNKRQDLLQYVVNKYGKEHVAQIAAFGTLAAKQVLLDVGRVFGLSVEEARKFSDAISFGQDLSKAMNEPKSRLADLVNRSEHNMLLFEIATALEGLPRNVSTHAAGVVISDRNLLDIIPLQEGSNEILLTQFEMKGVEKIGLLKMDFLGLRNLTIIANSLDNIERIYQEKLDIYELPLTDEKTLEVFQKGATSGIFQFESNGIRNALRTVFPNSIEDIAAVNALYRPGPQANIPSFAARKKGTEKITYPDERIRPILENTYGIIVYQEQIMQILQKMAGFSLGEADIVRRAVSKKIGSLIEEEGRKFLDGAKNLGVDESTAKEVYALIEKFASYGFNRSHAFAYSFIAYQMAYLKVHYPGAFYQALLRSNRASMKKVREYTAEAKKAGIQVLTPDINKSFYSFNLASPTQIRFGLGEIKGLRNDFIEVIINERKLNGAYKNFENFLYRMSLIDQKWLKDELLEALIFSGAFDSLHPIRQRLIEEYPRRIDNLKLLAGLDDLFGSYEVKESQLAEYPVEILLENEKKYLGTYLSTHPLEQFKEIKRTNLIDLSENQQATLLVQVKSLKMIRTKKNEAMCFIKAEDETGEIDITIFPKLYRVSQNLLEEEKILVINGKAEHSKFNDNLQILAQSIEDAQSVLEEMNLEILFIKLSDDEKVPQLKETLGNYKGKHSVILVIGSQRILLNQQFKVEKSAILLEILEETYGKGNAVFFKKI